MKGKKKLLTLPLAAAMVLSLAVPAMAAEETAGPEESAKAAFTDVAADAWYAPAVSYVTGEGIMNGTGEAVFSPDMTVTRGMVYQTLYNMAGRPAVAEAATFHDVAGKWYADAAAWAEDEGLTAGTGQGAFDGERAMTRQELGKVFADYADAQGAHAANADLSAYTDAASVADWARDGVERAVALGLLSGNQNRLSPTGTAQRSELAQLLMNFGALGFESPAEAYIQAHADDFFLTGKTEYTIQGMMVSKETSFHNELENVDYTATDDGESVVLKGTVGEQWVAKLSKVLETYTKADGTALTAEDFTGSKDTFIDLKTKAEPDTNFACFVPADVRLTVNTAWGDVLTANRAEVPHGDGDYLVCTVDDAGQPNLSDVWVVNGEIFPDTYDMTNAQSSQADAA